MNKIIYIAIFFGIIGCSLDIPIENSIADPLVITDASTQRSALSTAYISLDESLPFKLSLLAGDFKATAFAPGDDLLSYKLYGYDEKIMTDFAEEVWTSCYESISHVNNVLYRSLDLKSKDRRILHGIAECLTLKAYNYFLLLRLFSTEYSDLRNPHGIILRNNIPDRSPGRSSKKEVVEEIIKLIEEAQQYYAESGITTANCTLNLPAALQLKAQVYLYTKEYKKALEACEEFEKIINLKNIKDSDYDRNFWMGKDNKRAVWIKKNSSPSFYQEIFGQNISDFSRQCYLPDPKLKISETDRRWNSYMYEYNGKVLVGKYNLIDKSGYKVPESHVLMRSGEMIYIKAECLIETGTPEKAAELMMSYHGTSLGLGNDKNKSENINLLKKSKLIEFMGEGLNFFDIKESKNDSKKEKRTLPIPPSEIKYNLNDIEQNGSWPKYNINPK